MRKMIAAALFLLLTACAGQDNLQAQVIYTATAVDGVAKAALIGYNAGLIKPNSDADKGITAALHTAKAAVNNANDALKSGNTQAVTYYTSVATAAAAQATTEVNKYLPPPPPKPQVASPAEIVSAGANTPAPTTSQ